MAEDARSSTRLLDRRSGFLSGIFDLFPALVGRSSADPEEAGAAAAATVNLLAQGFNVIRLDSDDDD
jgi:hypothetical protein